MFNSHHLMMGDCIMVSHFLSFFFCAPSLSPFFSTLHPKIAKNSEKIKDRTGVRQEKKLMHMKNSPCIPRQFRYATHGINHPRLKHTNFPSCICVYSTCMFLFLLYNFFFHVPLVPFSKYTLIEV